MQPFYHSIIGGGGVADAEGNFIEPSGRYRDLEHTKIPGAYFGTYETETPVKRDEKVIYLGHFADHWGHFLLESTTRLYYPLINGLNGYKLVMTKDAKCKVKKNYKQFFELCGFKADDIIFISKPTQFQEVIVPEASSIIGKYATKEFKVPFERIMQNVNGEKPQKIYFSRKKFKLRLTRGEEKIEKLLKQNGYKIYYPEKLSLKKTVSILKNATHVAGIQGTALHNILFAKENSECITFIRQKLLGETGFFEVQHILCELKNIKNVMLDASFDFLPTAEEPFIVGITEAILEYSKQNNYNLKNIKFGVTINDLIWYFKNWLILHTFKKTFYSKSTNFKTEFEQNYDIKKYMITSFNSLVK